MRQGGLADGAAARESGSRRVPRDGQVEREVVHPDHAEEGAQLAAPQLPDDGGPQGGVPEQAHRAMQFSGLPAGFWPKCATAQRHTQPSKNMPM